MSNGDASAAKPRPPVLEHQPEGAFGVRIPPTNLKPDFGEQATAFAHTLAEGSAPAAKVREAAATARDGD